MFKLFGGKKGTVAHMGEENTLYYNAELQRWVEKGKEHEVQQEVAPPPPSAGLGKAAIWKTVEEGNPASRYVPVGGFVRSTAPATEGKPSFMTPSKLPVSAPPTGDFFIPESCETPLPHATQSPTADNYSPVKYKGFRVPSFIKPEGVPDTQEDYQAEELRKFKARIDKKESRMSCENKSDSRPGIKENGIHRSPGSGKLENSWLTENGDREEDSRQPFGNMGSFQQQDTIDSIFGTAPQFEAGNSNDDQHVELYAVEKAIGEDATLGYHQTMLEGTGWIDGNNDQMAAPPADEPPMDFDSWGKDGVQAEAGVSQTPAANENTVGLATTGGVDYPGSVRERMDDPYDIAWLTRDGWTDQKVCRDITKFLADSYEDDWRAWHKDETFWEEFWEWYYGDGFDIVHPANNQQQPEIADAAVHTTQPGNASISLNSTTHSLTEETTGAELSIIEESPEITQTPLATESPTDPDATVPHLAESTPASYIPSTLCIASRHFFLRPGVLKDEPEPVVEQGDMAGDFVPENDSDFWDGREGEGEESVVVAAERTEKQLPCTGKNSSSKLPSWEDEFLFSFPDPWTETPSSEDGMDDGRLPFSIFNHEGMLQFLQTVNELLDALSGSQTPSPTASQLHKQVKELIKAVQMTKMARGAFSDPVTGRQETELLRQELESRNAEFENQRRQFEQAEVAQKQSVELEEQCQSLYLELREQEAQLQDSSGLLRQAESELEKIKEELEACKTQLASKEEAIGVFENKSTEKQNEINQLRESIAQLESDASQEREKLLQDLASTKAEKNATAVADEASIELQEKLTSLQEELQTKEAQSRSKDEEIARLTEEIHQNQAISEGNNVVDTNDELMERIQRVEAEYAKLRQELRAKDVVITDLEDQLRSKEEQLLQYQDQDQSDRETVDRQRQRLEQAVNDKEIEIRRLTSLVASLPKKDVLISKLTSLIGEKDGELMELRELLGGGREREQALIEQVSAKDIDLENVVHSLLFSQKQIAHLSRYCHDLGGDPQTVLGSVTVGE